jgi:hypothetical protein
MLYKKSITQLYLPSSKGEGGERKKKRKKKKERKCAMDAYTEIGANFTHLFRLFLYKITVILIAI